MHLKIKPNNVRIYFELKYLQTVEVGHYSVEGNQVRY